MVQWGIATYVRIKPPRPGQKTSFLVKDRPDANSAQILELYVPEEVESSRKESYEFAFSQVFDTSTSQEEIFDTVCKEVIQSSLEGYNGTIFAYGQTGSGKTFTMTGGDRYHDRGIIPRAISAIYEEFEHDKDTNFSCFISFLEIYNETVYDLLDSAHTNKPIEEWTKVQLMDDDMGDMHFKNLGVYEAISEEEALNLLFLGNVNRVTSETAMNQASSRSHSIFSMVIEGRHVETEVVKTSTLHLVDLAGSERVHKYDGSQKTRKEGKYINLSLHYLEKVILSLQEQQTKRKGKRNLVSNHSANGLPLSPTNGSTSHIPYRNSMLTSVLRGSLGGNCKSVFLATLNPEEIYVEESISTCQFMMRCSQLRVEIKANEDVDVKVLASRLEEENRGLKEKLQSISVELINSREECARQRKEIQQLQSHKQNLNLVQPLSRLDCPDEPTGISAQQHTNQVEGDMMDSTQELGIQRNEYLTTEPKLQYCKQFEDLIEQFLDAAPSSSSEKDILQNVSLFQLDAMLKGYSIMKENIIYVSESAAEARSCVMAQEKRLNDLQNRLVTQRQQTNEQQSQVESVLLKLGNLEEKLAQKHQTEEELKSFILELERQLEHKNEQVTSTESNEETQVLAFENEQESDFDSESDDENIIPPPPPLEKKKLPVVDSIQNVPQSQISEVQSESGGAGNIREAEPIDGNLSTENQERKVAIPSAAQIIRKRLQLLTEGGLFLKHGRRGRPHVRYLWVSHDYKYIHYRKLGDRNAKVTIPAKSVTQIVSGQQTKVFKRSGRQGREHISFSIQYDDSRTLDLEVDEGESFEKNKKKCAAWKESLNFLLARYQ